MLFGLACEGVTDQITLENILCGYFENSDLDEAITELQPLFDETDQKQGGYQRKTGQNAELATVYLYH